MIKKVNNQGFGIIPILVLSLVLGLGVLVGYTYYNPELNSTASEDASLQASAEVSGDENVLQLNTPKPLPAGTAFNYVIASNRVTVNMYGSPTFVRVLTSAPNRVNVRLISSTGAQTNQTLVLGNIAGGKRIVFNINDTIAKIEFPAVTGIGEGLRPSGWSDTPTRNGIQRTVIACNNEAPEFFMCEKSRTNNLSVKKIYLRGCGSKLLAAKSKFEETGLFIGQVPKKFSGIDTVKGAIVKGFKPTSSSSNLISYEISHSRDDSFYNDPYPFGIFDLIKNKSYTYYSKDGNEFVSNCSTLEEYLRSNSAKPQSRTSGTGSRS